MSQDAAADRQPNPVDRHVGQRVRVLRKIQGISQERLADALGLTFQQVQKYEKGSNRISASKLWDISRFLNKPIAYFFEEIEVGETATGMAEPEQANFRYDFLATTEGIELAQAFPKLKPKQRRKLLELVRAMAGDEDED
ncbi:MAG TPA: helix-turn-helix transcriptional regulator [Caulobacteraceae bacterium]